METTEGATDGSEGYRCFPPPRHGVMDNGGWDLFMPVCVQCGYNLHKLEAERCPECGWEVRARGAAA